MKKRYLFCNILLGLCIAPMFVYAQASLVKDIFPGGNNSNPTLITNVNGTLFFQAEDGIHGRELWKSDGTEAGTVLVKDINPGGGASNPAGLTNVNGTLFFQAEDGTHGRELWKSDGTEAGTVLVKDIFPGSNSSSLSILNVNGTLFITADDGTHGRELWKSDGTEAGTVLVKDIFPGSDNSISLPPELANVNSTLFFWADDGLNGFGLWKSDGTEAGTVLIKVIPQLSNVGISDEFTSVNGTLFFVVWDAAHGEELWRSDGTEAGTFVLDINPGSRGSAPELLTNVNGTLFFWAFGGSPGEELWKSDGTEAGTVLVKDIYPGGFSQDICCLTNVNGTLFFRGEDGIHGPELWKSDGTEAGTVLVKDILPGSEGSSAAPSDININGNVFFWATDGSHGGLWKSDGTEAGTILAAAISPGIIFSLENIGSTLYFQANDGTHGRELWKYEETIQKQAVTSFTLVNADTDTDILELTEGMQLKINTIPNAKLNIRANTDPPTVGSVFLQLSGTINSSRTENAAPYALFGDNRGDYNKHNLRLGNYTITATPYTMANRKGEQGMSLSLNFSIVSNRAHNMSIAAKDDANSDYAKGGERLLQYPQKSWVYPNPFTQTLTIELSDFNGESVEVHLFDLYGKPLMMKNIPTTSGAIEVDVEQANMGAGPYLLKLIWGDRVEVIKLIRKNQ